LKIGTRLLETIIDTARKEACKKARWQVSGWNKEAIRYYKKIGALIDPTEINCDLIL
jgi:GNAT superfamily N-acetyltransferase